jgi:hypothetical protein
MNYVGIVGARKYKNRKCIQSFIKSLPGDSIIVTGACEGVCSWAIEQAEQIGLDVLVFKPDLSNTNHYYEVAERYYQRNRELIEKCDFVHAFFSKENGYKGGTKFEVEYAIKLGKPVRVYTESKIAKTVYQPELFSVEEKTVFNPAWQHFFVENVCR